MTSKERVYAAIRRKTVDRIPRFIWISDAAADQLCRYCDIPKEHLNNLIGNDVMQTWLSINKQMMAECMDGEQFVDEWGITWQRDGVYNTPVIHPMAILTTDEISTYHFPDPFLPKRYAELKDMIIKYGKSYFIGADISGSIFEPAYHLRGMENLLTDLALESPEGEVLLDRITDFTLNVALEAIKLEIDWVWLGDDMGTEKSMILSPNLWRRYFKPRMKKIIDGIRSIKPGIIIAYHSCGSIVPILSDLAELGIDVLNPIQESAAGMNQAEIKKLFGDRLTLMCGLDTQTFLPDATPQQVKVEMAYKAKLLSKNGGYIAAVSHTIQHDIPPVNILALLDELSM